MSNIIPPLVSSTPPPMTGVLDDEEDDEFGDFAAANDISFGCDALSLPSSPTETPDKSIIFNNNSDINSQIIDKDLSKSVKKDFQDKRKISRTDAPNLNYLNNHVNNVTYSNSSSESNKHNIFPYFSEIPPDVVCDTTTEFDDFQDCITASTVDTIEHQDVNEAINCYDKSDSVDCTSDRLEDFENSTITTLDEQAIESTKISDGTEINQYEGEEPISNAKPFVFLLENSFDSEIKSDCDGDAGPVDTTIPNVDEIEDDFNDFQVNSEESQQRNVLFHDEPINNDTIEETNDDSGEFNDFQNDLQEEQSGELPNISEIFSSNVSSEPIENILQNSDQSRKLDNEFSEFQEVQSEQSQRKHNISPTDLHREIQDNVLKTNELMESSGEYNDLEENDQEAQPGESQNQNETVSDDLDDDFGNFEFKVTDFDMQPSKDPFVGINTDDFNFGDFDNQVFEKQELEIPITSIPDIPIDRKIEFDDEDDNFSDFNDFSLQTEPKDIGSIQEFSKIDMKIAFEKSEELILEMFSLVENETKDFCQVDFLIGSPVFNSLKDVTDTSALTYQWGKSTSQKCLLQALNIDSRNILYGPRWNESIPRYAATLGFKPLEPVKSELLTPSLTETNSTATFASETSSPNEIPLAQFDWDGSGLTNPLENSTASTMLLDLEQLVASLDIQYSSNLTNKSPNSSSPINDIDEWEFWLSSVTPKTTLEKPVEIITSEINLPSLNILSEEVQETSPCELSPNMEPEIREKDSESVKSLKFNEIQLDAAKTNAVAHFPSFQSANEFDNTTSWPFNSVLLRETHITSNTAQAEPITTDFQVPDILKPVASLNKIEMDDDFTDFQIGSFNDVSEETTYIETKVESEIQKFDGADDDDFTDFQSTVSTVVKEEPAISILEPTKFSILQPTTSVNAPTSINWPDPGVAIDLHSFEFNYKAKLHEENITASNVNLNNTVEVEPKKPIKNNKVGSGKVGDDDEWSDFVSNQEPIAKTSPSKLIPTRTLTPELQLSVPRLNQIRMPKKPAPTITQQNFYQMEASSSKKQEPPVQSSVHKFDTYPINPLQPSLISNQFAAHFQQPFFNYNTPPPMMPEANKTNNSMVQNFNYSTNFNASQVNSTNHVEDVDDEWSDFISSQPAPFNGASDISQSKLNYDWNKPPQFTSWSTSSAPNIITNPVSFDSFQSYNHPAQTDLLKNRASTKKTPNVVIQPNSRPIPSISSVPDLEFIGTKSKTWKK